MKCKNCGCENPDNAVFCKSCGKNLKGAVFCPSCGKQIDGDSDFCIFCGYRLSNAKPKTVAPAAVQSQPAAAQNAVNTAEKPKKVINYITAASALALAAFSLIFVFLIGFSGTVSSGFGSFGSSKTDTYLYYYFGDCYSDLEKLFKGEAVTNFMKLNFYLPEALGTVIAAVTILVVAITSILAIVYGIRYLIGKGKNNGAGLAFTSFAAYVAGSALLLALNNFIVKSGSMVIGCTLNGATIAGVVLSSVCAAVYVCCGAIAQGKELLKVDVLIKLILSLVAAVFTVVVLALTSLPAFGTKSDAFDIGEKLSVGITTLMSAMGILCETDKDFYVVKNAEFVLTFSILAIVALIALAILSAALIKRSVASAVDKDKKAPIALNAVTVAVAVLFLAFSILTAKQFVEAAGYKGGYSIEGTVNTNSKNFAFTYAVPIVILVFSVLSLVVNIVQFCIKKSFNSAAKQNNGNQPS